MTYSTMICMYLLVCFLGLVVVMSIFNRLIEQHDKQLTGNICGLIAEKMNNSIDYLTHSVQSVAQVLPDVKEENLDMLYNELATKDEKFISSGMLSVDGTFYATQSEIEEFTKWNLFEIADNCNAVAISEPYRSSATGKLVFTILAPLEKDEKKVGTLFVTYPLDEIQNMAKTRVLSEDAEIYLMNAYSGNIILCSGADPYRVGNWNNTKSYSAQIITEKEGEYAEWEESMRTGPSYGAISFTLNKESYTQVYERIQAMEGWSVVVRIPNKSLSDVMVRFQILVAILLVIMIVASVLLFVVLHRREVSEKKILENLSVLDPLTQVLNRRAFEFAADNYLEANGEKTRGSLLFLDVDHFKEVNDRFGHDIGDRVLMGFANGLKAIFSEDAIVSRYGGDEFVVLVKRVNHWEELNLKLDQFREMLKEIDLGDVASESSDFELHFSAGIANFPETGTDLKTLSKNADSALYEVKKMGRNGYKWYVAK